jgi:hypothetical protein
VIDWHIIEAGLYRSLAGGAYRRQADALSALFLPATFLDSLDHCALLYVTAAGNDDLHLLPSSQQPRPKTLWLRCLVCGQFPFLHAQFPQQLIDLFLELAFTLRAFLLAPLGV